MSENAFDFHFASFAQEYDREKYEYHHKLSFREDIISVMKKGSLPFSLDETIKLVEVKESNETRIQEAEKLKSTDSAVVLYEEKFQVMKNLYDKREEMLKAAQEKIAQQELEIK